MLMRSTESIKQAQYGDFDAIKRKFEADYNANQSAMQTYWTEATIDTRLEAGDNSLMGELNPSFILGNRTNFYFNRVRPLGNVVSGHQRQNRKSPLVIPLENGDQQTADQWTKILLGIYKRERIYKKISDAFHQGAFITGMNMLHVYMDWSTDPINGDVRVENLSYNQYFIDTYFRNLDLSDCKFIIRRSYLSHSQAASLLPENYDEIMALQGSPSGIGRDGKFQYMPEAYGKSQQNLISYDEYYFRDYRKQRLFVDEVTGDQLDIDTIDDIDEEEFLRNNPTVKIDEQMVPTVKLAIMVQGKVFYCGANPLGIDCYPFVPVVGYFNPMMPTYYARIQGICRSLRDPQILYNRRVLLSADAAESVVNTGFIFKEGAPLDVKHLFQTGQGRMIPIKDEYQISDIQPISPPVIPQYFFTLQDTFAKELNFVSGINEEQMGFNYDDKSGYRSFLQKLSGITTLQPILDKLDDSQELLDNIIMKIVQRNYTPAKVKRLLEGEEPAPLFYNKAFGKYHSTVTFGFNTDTQKQQEFVQLMQLKENGVNIPQSVLIEAATIQNKGKLIQQMALAEQQQAQISQLQMQATMQEQQARTQLAQSRAIADQGLGIERLSRVEENKALAEERRAQAIKDEDIALYNKIKAFKELEEIDLQQLERLIIISNKLKNQSKLEEQMV